MKFYAILNEEDTCGAIRIAGRAGSFGVLPTFMTLQDAILAYEALPHASDGRLARINMPVFTKLARCGARCSPS
jgi:hypothetical protein